MTLYIGAAGVTASVIGTATPVIYTAAVILSGAGVGLADTGSPGLIDQEHAGAPTGGGALASLGLTPTGAPGDTLLGFVHANLDPHTQPTVGLVGAVLHNLGVG